MIWRRLQVSEDCTFYEFHTHIQDAMGWEDYHLHKFYFEERYDEDYEDIEFNSHSKLKDYFQNDTKYIIYAYDFGDGWEHKITLEKILQTKKKTYPICMAGKRACPPEDCGGIYGYKRVIQAMKKPKSREYREVMEWLVEPFNSEEFNIKDIEFRTIPSKE